MSGTPSQPPDGTAGFAVEVLAGAGEGRSTIAVSGELDIASVPELERSVRAALDSGPVLLDLSGTTFMDSSGIGALDALLRDCDPHGWDLRVAPTLHPDVHAVLELTGMLAVLPFASNTRSA